MAERYEDPYEVAKTYWKDLKPEEREWQNVAERLGLALPKHPKGEAQKRKKVVALNKLGRLARRWEERRLVRHTVLKEHSHAAARAERAPDLEEALLHRFRLRHAVVVDTSPINYSPDDKGYDPKHDDEDHRALGVWGGRILNVCLRGKGDVIGTGGGRGAFYTVRSCIHNKADYPKQVVSLTGNINASDWSPDSDANLDADKVAGLLTISLEIDEPVLRVGCGIVKSETEASISTHRITFAVTGIGALAGGHRLLHFERSLELAEVRDKLQELRERVQRLENKFKRRYGDNSLADVPHHWVGDLCNQLFLCYPLEFERSSPQIKEEAEKLKTLVNDLNKRFRTPDFEQIHKICENGGVLAVCGGRHKVYATHWLLTRDRPHISHLITNKWTAEKILQLDLMRK